MREWFLCSRVNYLSETSSLNRLLDPREHKPLCLFDGWRKWNWFDIINIKESCHWKKKRQMYQIHDKNSTIENNVKTVGGGRAAEKEFRAFILRNLSFFFRLFGGKYTMRALTFPNQTKYWLGVCLFVLFCFVLPFLKNTNICHILRMPLGLFVFFTLLFRPPPKKERKKGGKKKKIQLSLF